MTIKLDLTADNTALLIIDVQNDFCPGGQLAVQDGDQVVAPINLMITSAAHIVATQDWHPDGHASFATSHEGRRPFDAIEFSYGMQTLWPDHCVQGSAGHLCNPVISFQCARHKETYLSLPPISIWAPSVTVSPVSVRRVTMVALRPQWQIVLISRKVSATASRTAEPGKS